MEFKIETEEKLNELIGYFASMGVAGANRPRVIEAAISDMHRHFTDNVPGFKPNSEGGES